MVSRREKKNGIVIRHHDVSLAGLGRELDGYRIIQISDVHLGRRTAGYKALEAIENTRADLVVLTGDLVHRAYLPHLAEAYIEQMVEVLDPPDGFLAVLGNHDGELDRLIRADLPVRWLVNRAAQVVRGTSGLNFLGLDQRSWCQTDVWESLSTLGAGDGFPIIVLGHYPRTAVLVANFADLVIAGHTHAGQIKLPGLPFYTNDKLGWRYGHGRHKIGKTQLIISAGLGYSWLPVRICSPPEVVVITLSRS